MQPSVLCELHSMPGGCPIMAQKIEDVIAILQNHIRDRTSGSKSPLTSSKNPSTLGKNLSTLGKNPSTSKLRWILSRKHLKGKNSSGDKNPSGNQSPSGDQSPLGDQSPVGKNPLTGSAVVKAFHSRFSCKVHCKVALASMMKYPNKLVGEQTYLAHLTVCL